MIRKVIVPDMTRDLENALSEFINDFDKDWHLNILYCSDVYNDAGYILHAEACLTAQRLLSHFIYEKREEDELRLLALDDMGIVLPKKYKYIQTQRTLTQTEDSLELVFIPPGTFVQGVENTQVPIFMEKGFWLQTDVVTQKIWKDVMEDNPSNNKDPQCWEDLPVENISWNTAKSFIDKVNKYNKGTLGFLKDYQCEYAFRAMTTTPYTFGKDGSKYNEFAWAKENSDGHTHPVKQLRPNLFGLYDVNGNTWEWGDDKEADGSYHSQYMAIPEKQRAPLVSEVDWTDVVRGTISLEEKLKNVYA